MAAADRRLCLLPRLALSELLALSGVVRHLVGQGAQVMVVTHKSHASSVRSLYGDIGDSSLRFTFVGGWDHVYAADVLESARARGYSVVPVPSFRQASPYASLGIDSATARSSFMLTRNLDRECELRDRIVAAVGPTYVVLHDADDRRIRRRLLPHGVPVVDVRDPRWRTPIIFDWVRTMDHAVAVHAIDSCFMLLAETLSLRASRVLHAYAGGATAYPGATVVYS